MGKKETDFERESQKIIDKLPKKGNKNTQDTVMGMETNQLKMILSVMPKKQKALIIAVVVFVLYGLVSSLLDLFNLISWLC